MFIINRNSGKQSYVITIHHASNDRYRAIGNVITQKYCKNCSEWRSVDDYYVSGRPRRLIAVCKTCYKLDRSPKYCETRRQKDGKKQFIGWEARVTSKDGLEGYECPKCKEWKPLVDYIKTRAFLVKANEWKTYTALAACKQCTSHAHHRWLLLRRARQVFGEDSEEVRYLENEKRHYHFKAVCRLLGILSYKRLHFEADVGKVFGILPIVLSKRVEFEREVEHQAEEEAKARQRRTNPVSVHKVPPF